MFANLPSHSSSDQSTHEKSDRIQADSGLADRSRSPRDGRSPAEIQSGAKITGARNSPREYTDPRIQPQRGENNKDEECKYGGTGKVTIN